ncbi:MAG: TRAP transporter substrate-binding protein DctP [Oligoflexus sp.]
MKLVWIMAFSLCFAGSAYGKKVKLKIATMIPHVKTEEGKEDKSLSEPYLIFAKDVAKATDGRVKFNFTWGGVAGDENTVLRKIQSQQLAGAILTAQALSLEQPDVRVLEVPFTFKSSEQASKTLHELRGKFEEGFKAKNYRTLGMYNFGEIYFVTKKETPNFDALKGQQIWLLNGDKLAAAFIKNMDLVGKTLDLPSVISAFSSNMIDGAYAPAAAIVALQWHNRVSYLIKPPFGYHFQGFLLSDSAWKKINEKDQAIIMKLAKELEEKISATSQSLAQEALAAITASGVKVIEWPESDIKKFQEVRNKVLNDLTGKELSKEITAQVNQQL